MRMRTVSECARMLKEDDRDTALTENALRTKLLTGEIPYVKVGRKRLIDYDQLLEILKNPPVQSTAKAEYGAIRRVI